MFRSACIATLMLVGTATSALSQEPPNLIGKWSGNITGGARFGALNHDPAQAEPVFADRQKLWTLTIEKQDGAGLIGTWSSATKSERLAGAIRRDNVTLVLADEDNVFNGHLLSESELELCAQEGAAAKSGATIAVCYVLKRQ